MVSILEDQVSQIIARDIRPLVQQHGGDIEFIKIEHNNIYVSLKGACTSCPFSFYTMMHGVQKTIKEQLPVINDVILV